VPGLADPSPELLAIARTTGELLPYLAVVGAGFALGAWGQSARVAVAVVAGILLILIGTAGFMLDNGAGDGGVPGIPGV